MEEWKEFFNGHWKFGGMVQDVHIAMFPEELPYRIIRMFSFIGETVLDPFCGSGTTLKVAKNLYRKIIGYEINGSFYPIIKQKLIDPPYYTEGNFQALLVWLYTHQREFQFQFNFDFAKQKSIIAITTKEHQKVVMDLMGFQKSDFDSQRYLARLKAKFQENNILHFLDHEGKWAEMDHFVLLLDFPEEYHHYILNFINEIPKTTIQIRRYNEFIAEFPF
jgi:hypothetical protein